MAGTITVTGARGADGVRDARAAREPRAGGDVRRRAVRDRRRWVSSEPRTGATAHAQRVPVIKKPLR